MAKIICVPGSGDPFQPNNHIYRSRLEAAANLWESGDHIICYGRKQGGINHSEALLGTQYMKDQWPDIPNTVYGLNEEVKSTAETARTIAGMYDKTGNRRIVIVNTPLHLRRTRYLMNYHMQALGFGTGPYQRLGYHASNDVLKLYILQMGKRRAYTKRFGEILREIAACAKASADPDDKKINQNRKAGGVFSKIFG